jgi:hypothetical protein
MVASTAVNRGLLRTYMTQAVATFAATNDAVYNLLKPFILSYVLNASIVSTGASNRNRTGNVRLVIARRSDGTLTAQSFQLNVKSCRNRTSDIPGASGQKPGETGESQPFELDDGSSNYDLVLTTPLYSAAGFEPYHVPNSRFAGSHGSLVLGNRFVRSSKRGRTV